MEPNDPVQVPNVSGTVDGLMDARGQQDSRTLAEDFQRAWSEEMVKTNSNESNLGAIDDFSSAEAHASHWFGAICDAVKKAAKTTLPRKTVKTYVQRKISSHTNDLFKQKRRLQQKRGNVKAELKGIKSKIKASCLQDYRSWVETTVKAMEQANEAGDIKRVYKLVNHITGKPRKPASNLTTDENGKLLQTPEDVANTWRNFLSKKFQPTIKESLRPNLEHIPKTIDPITRKEFNSAIRKLHLGKATGPDGVPAVVYKACPRVKEELFKLLQFMWSEEVVPTSFATANFKMLFKGKGSSNNPAKYRCIALLNHAYKVLSYILLGRLIGISDDFLKDWQAGFRSSRGCRDNALTLRVICERMIALGKTITAVFIDYRAAFDSVSHKYVRGPSS